MAEEIGPLWGELHDHLIARIVPLDLSGKPDPEEPQLAVTFLDDATLSISLDWQSPLESMHLDGRAPALAAMAQSGALAPLADKIKEAAAENSSSDSVRGRLAQGVADDAQSAVQSLRGRAGLTKLNTTQVFLSMQPVRIQGTLYLRAWVDAQREVEAPLRKLLEWALPQALAETGPVLGILSGQLDDAGIRGLQALLPSVAPRQVGLRFAGRYYAPLVIDQLSMPLSPPMGNQGRPVEVLIQISLSSLTALDKQGMQQWFR